ncbi:MAG: tetratricopeptide repeat protein [Verrucomicrobia bacterium]|nr:tetratricopeptide repeat protein [Verrucomicrobiota bacterium]
MPNVESNTRVRGRKDDLLPNEREITYDQFRSFMNRNKSWIIGLLAVCILAAVGFVAWNFQQRQLRQQANEQFAAARSPEMVEAVAREFPGTDAELLASITVADYYFQQRQWVKAQGYYQKVLEHHSTSPLAPSALFGMAAILEANGKTDEALRTYREIVSSFPQSFQAPQVRFAIARLLEMNNRLEEARQAYEELLANHPHSAWKHEASARLQKINSLLKMKSAVSNPTGPPPKRAPG